MLLGYVRRTRDGLEPVLQLKVIGSDKKWQTLVFVIDTGFTGYLAVTREMLRQLGLPISGSQRSILADGLTSRCDVVVVTVDWDGVGRTFEAQVFDGDPLIGTRLLEGFDVSVSMNEGGIAEITKSIPLVPR